MLVFFVKQKTAYDMRISDWSSDVCSSDLAVEQLRHGRPGVGLGPRAAAQGDQRAGLFDTGREQAARAVVLEAAAVEADAGGQPDRTRVVKGQRVSVCGDISVSHIINKKINDTLKYNQITTKTTNKR